MKKNTKIAIVGSALIGPTVYRLFRNAGFDNVHIFEQSRVTHPTSGGVMGLRTDAIDILRNRAGIDTSNTTALRTNIVHAFDVENKTIHHRSAIRFPGETTSWDALHNELVDGIPIDFGYKVVGVNLDTGILYFKNGHMDYFDFVVFADGRKSTGRQLLDPTRKLEYQGYTTWRGTIDLSESEIGSNREGFSRYYDWDNHWLFALTEDIRQSGLAYWEFAHPLPDFTFEGLTNYRPTARTFLLPDSINQSTLDYINDVADYRNLPDDFAEIIHRTTERYNVMGIPNIDGDFPNKIVWKGDKATAVLLGDAILPTRPQTGAGLNEGICQAHRLVQYLVKCQDLKDWERISLDKLALWIDLGRQRASHNGLGYYKPIHPGKIAVPSNGMYAPPKWMSE